jgi:large subunit ribosomal protein L20
LSINAALRALDATFTYGRFINAMTKKNVILDRKILADMAVSDPDTFAKVVKQITC